jgi:hypothetical protein
MCKSSILASPPSTPGECQRLSVFVYGREEAWKHKWIESEKAGRDLGEWAIRCWIKKHWNGFLRARWLEHLQGKAFWIELDQHDFGLLQREFQQSPLIDPILAMLKRGKENLDVLNVAHDQSWTMADVLQILESLDINSRRLSCTFDPCGC